MDDFYRLVPKDYHANLAYRLEVRKRANTDEAFRSAILGACKRDFLYFANTFGWLYEPRPRKVDGVLLPNQIPFITWPHQDKAIRIIREHLGFEDIGVEKARGEGASWIACFLAAHDWLFQPMTAVGFVSRNEIAVDSPDDSDSLMWKVDWLLSKLPPWMCPPPVRNRTQHVIRNPENGSTIVGYAATGDVASGGRKAWFLKDELAKFPRGSDADAMASTQHVTNSRLIVSTPKGTTGEFHRLMHEPSSMVKVIIDWKDNPSRNRGLYQFENGKPKALDPINNPLPANYSPPTNEIHGLFARLRQKGFKLDGKIRSPWYDHECDRPGATPQKVAQELDRDYGGSSFRFFLDEFTTSAKAGVRPPFSRGVIDYHKETLEPEFDRSEDGPILLWTNLDHKKRPPRHSYALGCDISTGMGASNSSVQVFDLTTLEQVLEYATNTTEPSDFADECIAIAKWFWDGYLAWEANGPGKAFTKRVLTRGYDNIYYRTHLWKRGRKKTKEAGWWTDESSKEAMFDEFNRSVKSGEITIRSDELVRECGQYIREGGLIVHEFAKHADDASKSKSHGDRVVAACIGIQALRDRPIASKKARESDKNEPPPNTPAARKREYDEARKETGGEWDDRETYDLAHPNQRLPSLAA